MPAQLSTAKPVISARLAARRGKAVQKGEMPRGKKDPTWSATTAAAPLCRSRRGFAGRPSSQVTTYAGREKHHHRRPSLCARVRGCAIALCFRQRRVHCTFEQRYCEGSHTGRTTRPQKHNGGRSVSLSPSAPASTAARNCRRANYTSSRVTGQGRKKKKKKKEISSPRCRAGEGVGENGWFARHIRAN